MIKIKIQRKEHYKDLGLERGDTFYALPTNTSRKRIYLFGIKIIDREIDYDVTSKYLHKEEGNSSKNTPRFK